MGENPLGDGFGLENPPETWENLSGTVVSFDETLIVETTEGTAEFEMGPSWFWEGNEANLNTGDEIVINGFYEGDAFEIGAIENQTTGETIFLRDETGRPLWAGRGRQGR
jgi:hypothetical protein